MGKVIIHYFTGTGNTAHAVKVLDEKLDAAGHEVLISEVKTNVLPPDEVCDYHNHCFSCAELGCPCDDCNRCINICPEQAIQVSVPLFILQMTINIGLTVSAIWAIITYALHLMPLNKIFLISSEIILIIFATIILLWVSFVPIYAFFNLLSQRPGTRRFFSKSYTRKFRRYRAPGFKP